MKLRDLFGFLVRAVVTAGLVGIVDWFIFSTGENDLSIALLPVFIGTILALASARFFPQTIAWRAVLITVASTVLSVVLQFLAIKASLPESTDAFITQLPSIALRLAVVLLVVNSVWEFTIRKRASPDSPSGRTTP